MMDALFTGTRMADLVIAFTVLEGLCLAAHHHATGRGIPPSDYVLNLLAGLCLMLALRSLLAGAAWPWQAAWLLAAGASHAADLWRRWRRHAPRGV